MKKNWNTIDGDLAPARGLVTFAVIAYNQEDFIRESVEGAFSQTYEPLEIVLSDDCSTDLTFEIMQEMAEAYKGPHTIRLNKNANNMGLSPHVRHIHEMSCGEYIVHAAGDDISLPHRTARIMEEFKAGNDQLMLIMSGSVIINCHGEEIRSFYSVSQKLTLPKQDNPINKGLIGGGHTVAISRRLVTSFQAPDPRLIMEDQILWFRAAATGTMLFIPDILVKYRSSTSSIWGSGLLPEVSSSQVICNEIKWQNDAIRRLNQAKDDLRYICHPDLSNLLTEVDKLIEIGTCRKGMLEDCWTVSSKNLLVLLFKYNQIGFLLPLKHYLIRWVPFLRDVVNYCRDKIGGGRSIKLD
jgi:Glycosyltransferases, probably involved in cell wall biogenesis